MLYFADESGTKLVPEARDVFYDINTSKERIIVDELIKGPETVGLKATIPSDTKVVSVTMNEGICYVNFVRPSSMQYRMFLTVLQYTR